MKYACLDDVDEYELLDDLLETMTYEKIILDIIIETCAVSGILSKKEVNDIQEKSADSKN